MRIVYKAKDVVQVFRLGTTSNEKIIDSKSEKIVQTYSFSKKQFELVASGKQFGMKDFFSVADSNCLDCPFNSFGKCYTHKFNQYIGFKSMLKSIVKDYPTWDDLPIDYNIEDIIEMSKDRYVRFGTYGEPSLHPNNVIKQMSKNSKSWTGYTHQWRNELFGDVFMASTHSKDEEQQARDRGYRSFVVSDSKVDGLVGCPASKEGGYKSNCAKCNLCSGTSGTKTEKSINILTH